MSKKGVILILIIMTTFLYFKDSINFGDSKSKSCVPSWSCTSWSDCSNSIQERECTDLNNCGYYENKPGTSQSCSISSTTTIPGSTSSCSSINWECDNSFSSCSNNFKTKSCCKYQPPVGSFEGGTVNVIEYLYCIQPTFIHGSDYGKIKVYLASSPKTGYDLNKLQQLSETWKSKINIASYGMIDNLEFTFDPLNPDFTKPNVGSVNLVNNYNVAYYFSDEYPWGVSSMVSSVQLYSSAAIGGNIPWAWTGPIKLGYFDDKVQAFGFWHDTLHEFAHTLGCDDYDGNIMRPLPDLQDIEHYPPKCLETIKGYIKTKTK